GLKVDTVFPIPVGVCQNPYGYVSFRYKSKPWVPQPADF
ncbi:MAG: hypothetical protein ACI96W_003048, partial [Paraglaciecola sp.]